LAELESLARIINEELQYIEEHNFTWVPLIESYKVYLSNLQNLGLLTPLEVEKITVAYYRYQEHAGYIAQLAEDQPDKPAIGRPIKCDFDAKPDLRGAVRGPLEVIRDSTKDAIEAVAKELSKTDSLASEQKERLPDPVH
jgi:hypothetical protein